jgi:hypothetical protein
MTNPRRQCLGAGALVLAAAMTAGTALGAPAHAATTGGMAPAYTLTLIKAGTIAGAETDVFGINNNGEVFGTGDLAGQSEGFVQPAGASIATFLGQPRNAASFSTSFPQMINNNGDVAGSFIANSVDNPTQAIEWPGGTTPTRGRTSASNSPRSAKSVLAHRSLSSHRIDHGRFRHSGRCETSKRRKRPYRMPWYAEAPTRRLACSHGECEVVKGDAEPVTFRGLGGDVVVATINDVDTAH